MYGYCQVWQLRVSWQNIDKFNDITRSKVDWCDVCDCVGRSWRAEWYITTLHLYRWQAWPAEQSQNCDEWIRPVEKWIVLNCLSIDDNDNNLSTEQQEEAKGDLELRRDAMQRVSASEYGQLYQESQQLRVQVQEIEEEMIMKRREYDALYGQYEALLNGEKLPNNKVVNEKIHELEQLCSKQREEIEEMRETMNDQYQIILARSRRVRFLFCQAGIELGASRLYIPPT